jgi:putative flippase GtrA
LYFLMVNYVWAYAIGFIVGTLFGFVFNKLWTFESEREVHKEIWVYFLVYLVSLGVGALLLKFLVNNIGLEPVIANVPVLVVTTIINFFGTKILAFRNKKW